MSSINTLSYVNGLPKILAGYNSRYHTSIKMNPNEAEKEENQLIFDALYCTGSLARRADRFSTSVQATAWSRIKMLHLYKCR